MDNAINLICDYIEEADYIHNPKFADEEEYIKLNTNAQLFIMNNKDSNFIIKKENEYGFHIISYMIDRRGMPIKNGLQLFVNTLDDDDFITHKYNNKNYYISSFEFYDNGILLNNSLSEKIYSNRTEYFINGKFSGYMDDKNIMNIIKHINIKLLYDMIYPFIIEFIEKEEQKCIIVNKYSDMVKIII